MERPAIEFVNHACVIVDTGSARILCDPWLTGSVFDNGWNLIVETGQKLADLDFTHIWFSHEHPDHFSPPTLKGLPEERRRRTPVLYQQTRDQKVRRFCEALGFPTIELAPFVPQALDERVTVICDVVAGYDSWLHVRWPGGSVLNVNDCRLADPAVLRRIKAETGEVDLLMTQFCYANWVGNPGDRDGPRRAAEKTFRQIAAQCAVLRPRHVLPFASFIWFSHKENHFWNEGAVRVHDVVPALRSFGAEPVVLFPGDRWPIGAPVDNAPALARWKGAYDAVNARHLHDGQPVALADLERAFQGLQQRLRQRNDWNAVRELKRAGDLPATPIHLTDQGRSVALDIVDGLEPADATPADCDIRLSSAALAYVLSNDWGRGTITINGRFEANYDTLWRFFRQTRIAYANNIGKYFPESLTRAELVDDRSFILELIAGDAGGSAAP
jgi:UDP-MurNAc hydroxylase